MTVKNTTGKKGEVLIAFKRQCLAAGATQGCVRLSANRYASFYNDESATNKRQGNVRKSNALAKSKELQPNAQTTTVAAHLLLRNRTEKITNK